MNRIALCLLALPLIAATCSPAPPKPPPPPPDLGAYCAGSVIKSGVEGVQGAQGAIIGGEPSIDRRSTVIVDAIGGGYCSGVALSPTTVVTAAHCIGKAGNTVTVEGVTHAVTGAIDPGYGGITGDPDDIALMYVDGELPPPYVELYDPTNRAMCSGLVAQGHGQNEHGIYKDLRESPYLVLSAYPKTLITRQATPGSICYGDSGGPIYAIVDGVPQLAGVTSLTFYPYCASESMHVHAWGHRDWIAENLR